MTITKKTSTNIYSCIKAASAEYSGIPQYFIYAFQFDGIIDRESFNLAFAKVTHKLYPKISKHYSKNIEHNQPIYFNTENHDIDDVIEYEISNNYLGIINTQQQSPIIALAVQNQKRSAIWYLVNHVYNDALSAKMLHLAICQHYQQRPSEKNDVIEKLYCLDDESFLEQAVVSDSPLLVNKMYTLSKELIAGLFISSPLVKAKRLQYSKQEYGLALYFQRFIFAKTDLRSLPKGSTVAQLSALIAKAYMASFDSQNCNFTIPIDLRTRSMRWLLGNPIGGVFIRCKKEQSLADIISMIDGKLKHYQQKPILYWLYQMIRWRMKNMGNNRIYKKTLKYSSKAHFISTYLGQLDRCNAKKASLNGVTTTDNICYSYPLQTSIAISLAITSFGNNFSINLSASEHAFSIDQQRSFQQHLSNLLNAEVHCGRPFK